MIDFLIKSSISLLVLLLFFYLILESNKTHQFNRFYLLFSVVFSMILPFLSFEIIQEIPQSNIKIGNIQAIVTQDKSSNNYLEITIYSIYTLITLVLFIRFNRNIYKYYYKIRNYKTQDFKNAKLILLKEKTLPYTFLNFIFINKQDFENNKIEAELLTHELTHVNQKHSLDIIFIEFLKVIFWFNPVFYLYKKAIQLNHEFLADANVNRQHQNISLYQTLLLTKTCNVNLQLASNLNYRLTKKRFIMMTKTTSKTLNLIKKIAVLPILLGLIFMFCIKTVSQEKRAIAKSTIKVVTKKSIRKKPIKKENYKITKKDVSNFQLGLPIKNTLNSNDNSDVIYSLNSVSMSDKPEFIGGTEAFFKFIGENYIVPKVSGLKGKVFIQFVVETDGNLTDIKCLRDIGYDSGKEAIRVIKSSPKWKPGYLDGKPVRCTYQLPISIESPE